jgi:hypothetical protein
MITGRMRWYLTGAVGVAGLLVLAACSSNEPYGARYDENGYTYTHRQHGLYNDAQYRYQRSRDDDRYYTYAPPVRYGYAPPVQYNYYYYDGGYRRYGYRSPAYVYGYDHDGDYYDYDDDYDGYVRYRYRESMYDDDGDLIYYRNRQRD